jgi:hypothetical protein
VPVIPKQHNTTEKNKTTIEDKKPIVVPPKVIIHVNITNGSEIIHHNSTNTTHVIADICAAHDEITKAFLDLSLRTRELIEQFESHIKLYDKWMKEADNAEDKAELLKKEKKYLDHYLEDAILISELLLKLKAEIERYRTTKCVVPVPTPIPGPVPTPVPGPTPTPVPTPLPSPVGPATKPIKTIDPSGITQATDTLIQMITKRYKTLGLTMSPSLSVLLQIRNHNKKKGFLQY